MGQEKTFFFLNELTTSLLDPITTPNTGIKERFILHKTDA